MDRFTECFESFEYAEKIVALTFVPVSTLPMACKLNHGKIIIVNEQPTSYDHNASFIFPDIQKFCTALQRFYAKQ